MMRHANVSYYNPSTISSADPAKIQFTGEWNILKSIYASLLYYDQSGTIRKGAAESYQVNGSKIRFVIRPDLATASGTRVSAEDAYLSFKRLMILNSNTHGNIYRFIDCNAPLKLMADECPGLSFSDNTLEIKLKSPNLIKYFLNLISNPDFSIIPKGSVDWTSKELKIVNQKETSGAYYIEAISDDRAKLIANTNHYLISEKSPLSISLLHIPADELPEALISGKIDIIPTFAPLNSIRINRILSSAESTGNINIHKTLPIELYFIHFPDSGPAHIEQNERFNIGASIAENFESYFPGRFQLTPYKELFASYGIPTLEKKQSLAITELRERNLAPSATKLKGLYGSISFMLKETIEPFFNNYHIKYEPMSLPLAKADFAMLSMDAGFFDDTSFLSYCQAMGLFNMTDAEFNTWFDKLLRFEDEAEQIKYLQDFHYKVLAKGSIVPIGLKPYYAFARKPWKLNAYKMYAGSPLWMIEHE